MAQDFLSLVIIFMILSHYSPLIWSADPNTGCGGYNMPYFERNDMPYRPIDYADNGHLCISSIGHPTSSDYKSRTINYRRNGIQDFCVVINMVDTTATSIGTTIPLGSARAKTDCYKELPTTVLHAAGTDPNWALLNHLTMFKAQSYQPYDELQFVDEHIYDDPDFIQINPSLKNDTVFTPYNPAFKPLRKFPAFKSPDPVPRPKSPNPYFVEVTGVSMKGELLHNFLHFRIFTNLSVALGREQTRRFPNSASDVGVLHGHGAESKSGSTKGQGPEFPSYATGKISALLLMVKDQDGWPVGDFATPVPCERTCSKYSEDVFYGDERNAVPCSYTPPSASSHPGMFIFDADPGRYCAYQGNVGDDPNLNNTDPRFVPESARKSGVREVHATWSFSHDTCNFVQRLYIQTLIIEDAEYALNATFINLMGSGTKSAGNVIYGWSAQYNVLKTTKETLGARDYVNLKYFKERNSRMNEIDCHVSLFDSEDAVKFTFEKLPVPSLETLSLDPEFAVAANVPSRSMYHAALSKLFKANPTFRYFGQDGADYPESPATVPYPFTNTYTKFLSVSICRTLPDDIDKALTPISDFLLNPSQVGIRCPCPALASPEPVENRTADPARLHGRLIHASHMAIAYMFLTPIGCFVARYYKETFVTVFCFQEYWWFMWHVVTLIGACLFNIGAITSIARKKADGVKQGNNLLVHIVLGAISIFVFYMEIFTGFFRVSHPKKRMRQIFMHWLIGTMNNACAVMSMFAMAYVDQSGFSCNVAWTTIVWLLFVLMCYGMMEYNMRKTDKKLKLIPRRSYLPPPVKRLFTKEAPGRTFRMTMLVVFILGLVIIQVAVSYFIWGAEGGASCHQEFKEASHDKKSKVNTGEETAANEQDDANYE